jgi:antitoxin ParD1/3/4
MAIGKRTVSLTDPAFDYVRSLVESGEYPSLEEAVSGELMWCKTEQDARTEALVKEVERRLTLPLDQWIPIEDFGEFTRGVRERFEKRLAEEAATKGRDGS